MEECKAEAARLPVHAGAGLFVLIVLVGFLWRFAGLGKESIWLDEATSLIIARMDLRSEVAWAAADIHPPLYYFALHVWLGAGETEYSVRALSAVLGVLAVAILYALGRELFDSRVGLLSALLLALSPLHIWCSQEARMYAMVATMSLLSSYLLFLALKKGRTSYWLGYVLVSTVALYTHYFMVFVLLFHNLFIPYWLWQNKSAKDIRLKWLVAELAIFLAFLPWLPILCRQASVRGRGWVERSLRPPSVYALFSTWLYFNIGLDSKLYPLFLRRLTYILFGIPIVMAMGVLLWDRIAASAEPETIRTRRMGLVFCLLYTAVPLLTIWLLSQVSPMYAIRYLLPFLPPYYIIVARGIQDLKHWMRFVTVLCLVIILLVGNWNALRIEQRDDWRGISAYVLAQAEPGDVVLFSPRWNAKPFDYYACGSVAINMDLPIPVTAQAAEEVVRDIAQNYRRVWLIWQRGHYSDPNGIVKQLLDRQFQLLEAREFRGAMNLMLYDLQITRTEGS
ncbi:MAG: glycosyltransferase family 39 protein [Anaerolineae bacterium]